MEIGFLHLHKTAAILFLVLLLSKVILLLTGKKELLQKVRDKTRILEMTLGVLIVVTGGYLFFLKTSPEFYLYAKTILILAAIPLGIIGFKKMKTLPAVASLIIVLYIYGIAESRSLFFKPAKFDVAAAMKEDSGVGQGATIYTNLCIDCHGTDGKKGFFNSPDLTQSKLTQEQRRTIITEGKGIMQSYSKRLSSEEIDLVLEYIESLK